MAKTQHKIDFPDHNISYYDIYDSYFYDTCDKWVESVCGDPNCEYCNKRQQFDLNIIQGHCSW